MSCRELVELVTDYLEGALPPPERVRFEAHLALCDGCEHYLEQMRSTIALVGSLSEESVRPEMQQRLLDAFRDWHQG